MAGPIVLIDVSSVREGMLDELKTRMADLAEFVEASGTRAISYQFYLSPDERVMTVIQVHPDSESIVAQMAAAAPLFRPFADLLTMTAMDVYGEPSPELREVLNRKAELLGLGRPPTIHSLRAGFDRFRDAT
jgi:hypothetical protein